MNARGQTFRRHGSRGPFPKSTGCTMASVDGAVHGSREAQCICGAALTCARPNTIARRDLDTHPWRGGALCCAPKSLRGVGGRMALSSSYRAPRSAADRMDPPHNPASSGRANASRPVLVSSWGDLHLIFYALLFLVVGFGTLHVVFVGGQSGPLLPSSPPPACDRRTLWFHGGQRSERILS